MLKFLDSNEMKEMNNRAPKPETQWSLDKRYDGKREHPIPISMVVENGNSEETQVHECAADLGSTDHRLIWTANRRELSKRRGRRVYE